MALCSTIAPPVTGSVFIPLYVNYCPMTETMGRYLKRGQTRTSVAAPRLILEIDIGELLSVVVAHDEAGGLFFDRPRRREAAFVAVQSDHSRSSGFFWRPGLIVTANEAIPTKRANAADRSWTWVNEGFSVMRASDGLGHPYGKYSGFRLFPSWAGHQPVAFRHAASEAI
jgi:hypothetical protein